MSSSSHPILGNYHELAAWNESRRAYPMGFLDPRWHELSAWRQQARGKVLELLAWDPPAVRAGPRGGVCLRERRGDHGESKLGAAVRAPHRGIPSAAVGARRPPARSRCPARPWRFQVFRQGKNRGPWRGRAADPARLQGGVLRGHLLGDCSRPPRLRGARP